MQNNFKNTLFVFLAIFTFSVLNQKAKSQSNLEGIIRQENFKNKMGRAIPDIYDLFLEIDDEKYFIKVSGGEVEKTELEELIDKKANFIVGFREGLWDTDDPTVQSRVGKYVVILEVSKEKE